MSGLTATIIIFGSLFVTLAAGLPLSFTMGGVAVVMAYIFMGPSSMFLFIGKMWDNVNNFSMVALPLFLLMASLLQNSGIAEDLYTSIRKWMGGINGGLAAGSVIISAIFAAMSGLSATATISLGVIAMPSMKKYGYDRKLSAGCIMAGGALGILIPPSVMMIVYGMVADTSIGQLFIAGILPGLLLVSLFLAYVFIRTAIDPSLGPAMPVEDRVSGKEKLLALKAVGAPILIIISVIGSIYAGIASVTEAAALGVFATFAVSMLQGKLSMKGFFDSLLSSFKMTSMVVWIMLGSACFAAIYQALGAQDFIQSALLAVPGGKWGSFILMQLTFFILGMVLDPTGIIMITGPIYLPVAVALGFDPIWYGIIFVMNMEMAYLTPPFGFNLFYMKSIADDMKMTDIYKASLPFIGLQALGLIICTVFPGIVTWLPRLMMAR